MRAKKQKGLSDELIRNAPKAQKGKRDEYQDNEPSQLYLRVTDAEKPVKTFTVRYRLRGKDEPVSRMTLGTYPDMRLSEARNLARRAMIEVRAGNCPKTLKPRPKGQIYGDYLETFKLEHVQKQRLDLGAWSQNYADNIVSVLTHNTALAWGQKFLSGITTNDVTLLLDGIDSPSIRRLTYLHLDKLFSWAVGRGDLLTNPIGEAFPVPTRTKKRERFLTTGELVTVWQHVLTAKPISTYQRIVQLLIVTGQRRREVAHARWEEFDRNAGIWTIPASRAKNKKEHIVPMTDLAWNLFDAIPKKSDTFLFTPDNNVTKPFNSFSEPKSKMDEEITASLQAVGLPKSFAEMPNLVSMTPANSELLAYRPPVSSRQLKPWTLHDLRRTCSTWLNGNQVPPHIPEMLLNHSIKGMAGVYNYATYTEEIRSALEKWEAHLLKLAKKRPMDGMTLQETIEAEENTLAFVKPKRVIKKVLDLDLS
jgi:integrase